MLPETGAVGQETQANSRGTDVKAQRPSDLIHHVHVELIILKNALPGASQAYCEMEFICKKISLCGS